MIKKGGYRHTNHKATITYQLDNGISISFIIYNTCTPILLTANPFASMLTGQGLLPLAPSIQAQKWLRKNSKKTWIQIYNQRINQWKPEAYKLT